MYQHDPFLDDLLRKPMQMAMNDDEYDEYDEYDDEYDDEDDDDLFGEDVLQAVQDEREAEEAEAEAFAASLLGDQPEGEETAAAAAEAPSEPAKLFTRPGIRRNLIGYAVVVAFGFLPLALLAGFGVSAGLSKVMLLFAVLMLAGLALSVHNVLYSFRHAFDFTVSFDVRTFFRWREVVPLTVILLILGFANMGSLPSGSPLFTLSGKNIPMQQAGAEADAEMSGTDENVIFSSFDEEKAASNDNVTGSAVAVAGASRMIGDRFNQMLEQPVAGGAVGGVGGYQLPNELLPKKSGAGAGPVLKSDNPFINTFFLGGPLAAAFGYALIVGLAGAIFAAIRPFETPFSQKVVEIINIETGEVTSDRQPIAPIMKSVNGVVRVLLGLYYGATLGFILGLVVILPLNAFMRGGLMNPVQGPLLTVMGLTNQADLAFTNAVSLAAIFIPLVFLVVAKMAPQGLSVSEELMRQHYEIKPTGRFVPADAPLVDMSNPAAVSFGGGMVPLIPDDELETELANTRLMDELAMEDDNLTAEIIEEFGRDFESVFGIDTRELISEPQQRQASVDRKKLASALDESFGELGNVPVEVSAELGQASLPITEWLNLRVGTLVLLDKPANEEIDLLFNGVRKGKGKLVVDEDSLAVKVSQTNFQGSNGNGSLI